MDAESLAAIAVDIAALEDALAQACRYMRLAREVYGRLQDRLEPLHAVRLVRPEPQS